MAINTPLDSQEPLPSYESATTGSKGPEILEKRDVSNEMARVPSLGSLSLSSEDSEVLYPADKPLPLPIVIPQTSKVFKGAFYSPFVRAYVPELENYGIDQPSFLSFIDGLNESFVTHPIFQQVDIVGKVLAACYGVQAAQWAGIGLQVASGVAGAATSYARTRAYVEATNADLFHPSGLSLHILSTKKMMAKIGHPETRLKLPPLERTSDIDESTCAEQISETGPVPNRIQFDDPRMRRMKALEGYVMQPNFKVPPAVGSPDNLLRRMGDAHAKKLSRKQERKMDKRHRRVEKREMKHERAERRLEATKSLAEAELELYRSRSAETRETAQLDCETGATNPSFQDMALRDQRSLAKTQRKLEKKIAKRERKVDKRRRKADKKATKVDKKEHRIANKIYWIVITRRDPDEDAEDDSSTSSSDSEDET